MLKIENLVKSYSGGKVRAVDCINLEVKKGEIFGFIGPNGAGKTTTIKLVTGILKPDSGSITVDGFDMQSQPIEAKGRIGFVPDTHDAWDRLTGREYLNFIGDIYGVEREERRAALEKYLEMFEIADAVGDQLRTYSHGMRQKLMLTAALMHRPPLWILDEPLTGLDPRSAHALKKEMRAHCDGGNTVFFSTHVLEVAEKLCDRVAIIDNGRIVAVGSLDELRAGKVGESLEGLFLRLTGENDEK